MNTHFGEPVCLESYLLGPFGCLVFLILTDEQRKTRVDMQLLEDEEEGEIAKRVRVLRLWIRT